MTDDHWANDEWDDDWEPDHDEHDCCHDDYDYDWQGEATCNNCGYRWDLTVEEMEQMARWHDEYHRQPTVLERLRNWAYWTFWRIKQMMPRGRKPTTGPHDLGDDDLPF